MNASSAQIDRRRSVLFAASFALAACSEAVTPLEPPNPCAPGTSLIDDECRADLSSPVDCKPACAEGQVCIHRACAPENTPDLTGYWLGDARFVDDCGTNVHLFGATFPLLFDVIQTGSVAAIRDALDLDYRASVLPDEFRAHYVFEVPNNSLFDVDLLGVTSFSGRTVIGTLLGEVSQYNFADPSHPDYNPAYQPPCPPGPVASFRIDRQAEPIPRALAPDIDGVWEGPFGHAASCVGTSSGLHAPDLWIRMEVRHYGDGAVETISFGIRGASASAPFLEGWARGRFEEDTLHFGEGELLGRRSNLHFEAPASQEKGWGLTATLSWDASSLVGQLHGWLEYKSDPQLPYPCVLHSSFFRLNRVE